MTYNIRFEAVALVLCLTGAMQAQAPPSVPRVVVIGTGGTISSVVDPATGEQRTLAAKELVALVPALKSKVAIEEEDFSKIGSSSMTPEIQFKLAQRVTELFRTRQDVAGIVITHGTDSLEETAFLVDLVVNDPRPVVFAAAQRPPDVPDSDGPRNLENAIRIAISPQARGKGVLVSLNEDIHSARFVKKSHSIAVESFQSGKKGLLGTVDTGVVVFYQAPLNQVTIPAKAVEPNVDLVRLVAGDQGKFIDHAVATKAAGVVVEAFGRGNMPRPVALAVQNARKAGLVVVIVSRVAGGRVELTEGLLKTGVISGEDLDGLKARMLLAVALGATRDIPTIQRWFHQAGGVTPK
ncbi:MAG: asparaginase [Planctomycetes bacterium]|nr:asparaginase [Planctomycetota bacterium]